MKQIEYPHHIAAELVSEGKDSDKVTELVLVTSRIHSEYLELLTTVCELQMRIRNLEHENRFLLSREEVYEN